MTLTFRLARMELLSTLLLVLETTELLCFSRWFEDCHQFG
jgi:hypothetical protein